MILNKKNISHNSVEINNLDQLIKEAEIRVSRETDAEILAAFPLEKRLSFLHDLISFPLGKFLFCNKGANGFWTDYILNYPFSKKSKKNLNVEGKPLSTVEEFLLKKSPLTLSHRDRFSIFKRELQKSLKENVTLASIPCGHMRDLLELDFSCLNYFDLIGVDIDSSSLDLALNLARENKLQDHLLLDHSDAWDLKFQEKIDVIASNGLNVYEPNTEKRRSLYLGFYNALKHKGKLIMGFLSPPPRFNSQSEWNMEMIPKKDFLFEKLLFGSIIGSKWLNFQTSYEAQEELYSVGFREVTIKYDKRRIFPTLIAEK